MANRIPAFIMAGNEGSVINALGHTAREKVTSDQTGGAYYVFDVISPPGLGVPTHVHRFEDEVLFVADGEIEVSLGGLQSRVGPGSVANFAQGTPHAFRNVGLTPAKTIWFICPGTSFQVFFRKLAQVPPGPPDLPRLSALCAEHGMTLLPSS